jgi:hypothetical protein
MKRKDFLPWLEQHTGKLVELCRLGRDPAYNNSNSTQTRHDESWDLDTSLFIVASG